MATYVNDLRLKEIATGDEAGTWGTSTNTNLELIGEAFSFGTEAITTNADTHTTTIADGSTDPGRSMYLKYTGTLDSACTITIGPNTVSKMWFIENATSGSQNIIISQGSGANITIPAGDTKAVYSDGAGSGAAFVDAFASLNVVDLKVQDDLTVTDDMTVGGTLGVTGIVTLTDDLIIGDGKTIGSASDVDAMTIASNGQVTFTQTLIGTALDISGDIDVDGTTNLDVVDIDGAVDFASTTAHAGNATFADDAKVILGAGSDLQIYHDGLNSYVSDQGTGSLKVRGSGAIDLEIADGSEYLARFLADDAVQLYFNGNQKLATTNTGIDVTGTAVTDGLTVAGTAQITNTSSIDTLTLVGNTGSVSGVKLQAEEVHGAMYGVNIGSNYGGLAFHTNNNGTVAEKVRIDNAGNVGIGTNNPTQMLTLSNGTFQINGSSSFSSNIEIGRVGGDNNMGFATGGSERMRIDTSGNVGIGCTPTATSNVTTLEVSNATTARILVDSTGTGGRKYGWYSSTDGQFAVFDYDASAERMRIDSSGNVGIGQSNPSDYYATDLVVSSASEKGITIASTGTSNANYLMFADGTSGDQRYRGYIGYGHNDDHLAFAAAGTEKMRITSAGNVGIGTSSPAFENGNGLEIRNSSGNGSHLKLTDNASGTGATQGFDLYMFNSQAYIENYENAPTIFRNNGGERMRITSAGNVGIGTSSPYKSLTVGDSDASAWITSGGSNTHLTLSANGTSGAVILRTGGTNGDPSATTERMRIDSSGNLRLGTTGTIYSGAEKMSILSSSGQGLGIQTTSATKQCLGLYNSDAGGARHFVRFALGSSGTEVGNITSTGSTTAYNTSSDYRLKENVDYTWDATTRLKQLKPARFNFIADETNTLVDGFLAHEVSSVVPEAITGVKDGDRMQGIDQSKLVPLLVKTIQELEARITTLEG